MQDFKKLQVWQKSHFPHFSGSTRVSEFARFLRISAASASEVEYFSILVAELVLLDNHAAGQWSQDVYKIRRMISGLLASLSKS